MFYVYLIEIEGEIRKMTSSSADVEITEISSEGEDNENEDNESSDVIIVGTSQKKRKRTESLSSAVVNDDNSFKPLTKKNRKRKRLSGSSESHPQSSSFSLSSPLHQSSILFTIQTRLRYYSDLCSCLYFCISSLSHYAESTSVTGEDGDSYQISHCFFHIDPVSQKWRKKNEKKYYKLLMPNSNSILSSSSSSPSTLSPVIISLSPLPSSCLTQSSPHSLLQKSWITILSAISRSFPLSLKVLQKLHFGMNVKNSSNNSSTSIFSFPSASVPVVPSFAPVLSIFFQIDLLFVKIVIILLDSIVTYKASHELIQFVDSDDAISKDINKNS
jgi:hypothetical protein